MPAQDFAIDTVDAAIALGVLLALGLLSAVAYEFWRRWRRR